MKWVTPALFVALTSPVAAENLTVRLFDSPPKEGELTHDHVVFVKAKDKECPELHKGKPVTWYHIVVGGNLHQGISRSTRKCVVVSENPTKAGDTSWQHERVASKNGNPE